MAIQPLPIARKPVLTAEDAPAPVGKPIPTGPRLAEQLSTSLQSAGAVTSGIQAEQEGIKKAISERDMAQMFEKYLQTGAVGLQASVEELQQKATENEQYAPLVDMYAKRAERYTELLKGAKSQGDAERLLLQYYRAYANDMSKIAGQKTVERIKEESKARMEGGLKSEDRLRTEQKIRNEGKTTKQTVHDKKETKKLEQAKRDEPAAVREYRNNMFRFGFSFDLQGNPKYKPTANPEAAESTIRKSLKKLNDVRASLGKPKLAFGDMIAEQDEATPGSGAGISTGTGTGANKSLIEKAKKMLSQVKDPEKRKQIQEKIRLLEQQMQGNR